jgi:hypothetical protein
MSGSGSSDDWKYRGTGPVDSSSPRRGVGGISGGGTDGGNTKCDIHEETPLNSPVPTVIQKLHPGDLLTLELQGHSVVALTSNRERAGSITFRRLADLLECIGEGWTYVAEVKRVSGGLCMVLVRPESHP